MKFWVSLASTTRMVYMLATTVTCVSGTRCAAQMALVPVGSDRIWKAHASSGSPTISDSPEPSKESGGP